MDTELSRLASRTVNELDAAPGAVVAAAHLEEHGWRVGIGSAGVLAPGEAPVTPDTIFDLASVTKPFTALAAARLARRGTLFLTSPLGALLEEAVGTPSADVTLELLLSHRAGLAAHRTLFAPLLRGEPVDRRAALVEAANARRDDCAGEPGPEGFPPLYSDLGYLLAGEAMARAASQPLADVVEGEVTLPLGLGATTAEELIAAGLAARVAPTEEAPFRGGVVRCAVHDENAWAIGGLSTCGHAGLFGTAEDVLRLGMALLDVHGDDRPDWLSPKELAPLLRRRPGGTLRAGFDGKSKEGSSAGERFGPASFGHLGFTGTSLWVDPDAQVVGVLLTNRVFPTRERDGIRRARPLVHDGIFAWAKG